jgi:sec-independent protein translocase protein TatB
MFGMSGTELIIIAIVALLLFPPHKLPEMARTLGKTLREFRKATEGIRQTVEQEFYKMDQELEREIGVHNIPLEPPPTPAVFPPPSASVPSVPPVVSADSPPVSIPAAPPAQLAPPPPDPTNGKK